MKKYLVSLVLITLTLTACGTKNVSNNNVKESSESQFESIVENVDITVTQPKPESVGIEVESENTELEVESENTELEVESENTELEVELENIELRPFKAGIVYIGESRVDLNSWESKNIYEIIDEISSTNIKFGSITGTVTHDVEFLDNGIPVDDVKVALNDMKSKLIDIRFGDVTSNFGNYKLSLYKQTDEYYSLSLEVRFTDNFYIGDNKKSVIDLGVMEKDINFEELSKSSDLFDGYIILPDISILESSTMEKSIQLSSDGTYTYSLYKYNPEFTIINNSKETQEKEVVNSSSELNDIFLNYSEVYNNDKSLNMYSMLEKDIDNILNDMSFLGLNSYLLSLSKTGEVDGMEISMDSDYSTKDEALLYYNQLKELFLDGGEYTGSIELSGSVENGSRPEIKYIQYFNNGELYNKTISVYLDNLNEDNFKYTSNKYSFNKMSDEDFTALIEPLVKKQDTKYVLTDGVYELSIFVDVLNNINSLSVKKTDL